jgi:hypothetical protein
LEKQIDNFSLFFCDFLLFYLAHQPLVDVNEVSRRENCQSNLEREYGWVLLHRHKVAVPDDIRENERLKEDSSA